MRSNRAAAVAVIASLALGACAHVETPAERDALAASLRPDTETTLAQAKPECIRVSSDGGSGKEVYISVRADAPDAPPLRYTGDGQPIYWADLKQQYAALVDAGLLRPSPRTTATALWFEAVAPLPGERATTFCYGKRTFVGPITLTEPSRHKCLHMRWALYRYVFTGVPAWALDPRMAQASPKARRIEGEVVEARFPLMRFKGEAWRENTIDFHLGGGAVCL